MSTQDRDYIKKGYHHGDLRRALVEAGLEIIAADGVDAFTMRRVARRVGVTHTAPYRHFNDKRALLAAIAEHGFQKMEAHMLDALDPDADALPRLTAIGLAYVDFATAHPTFFRVMFGPELADRAEFPDLQAAAQRTFGLLEQALVQAQQAGVVRPGAPRDLALFAWAVVHGTASLFVNGQVPTSPAERRPRVLAAIQRLTVEGLGA